MGSPYKEASTCDPDLHSSSSTPSFVMDAWQYVLHRTFHESRFLYKHFHSHHHRLYVPYAFGALYNHPLEGEWGGKCVTISTRSL
jgi:hypothetical protein